jgi:hypothetical protein
MRASISPVGRSSPESGIDAASSSAEKRSVSKSGWLAIIAIASTVNKASMSGGAWF